MGLGGDVKVSSIDKNLSADEIPREDDVLSSRDAREALVNSFLRYRGLVCAHIDSYDQFINVEMNKIMQANNTIVIEDDPRLKLTYLSLSLGRPSIDGPHGSLLDVSPNECRLRDLTYSAPILARVEYTMLSSDGYTEHRPPPIPIGRMPIMLRSAPCILSHRPPSELMQLGECPLDSGGYFVVRGTEKVLLSQEQLAKNRIIVDRDSHGDLTVSCTSASHFSKTKTTFVLRGGRIYLRHNSFSRPVPVAVLFRAFGVESDQRIISLVGTTDTFAGPLLASLGEAASYASSARAPAAVVYTQQQALSWLGQSLRWGSLGSNNATGPASSEDDAARADQVADLLSRVILCHIPVNGYDYAAKAAFTALMLRRLLEVSADPTKIDDKDYMGNKRVQLGGHVMSLLFEDAFKRFNMRLKRAIDLERRRPARAQPIDFATHMFPQLITDALVNSLSSGNLKIETFHVDRAGATQVLVRYSYLSALGIMARVNSQFEKSRKVSGPRALQPSQWGFMCPSDTPEGEGCGLVKNLALAALVTDDADEADDEVVRRVVFDLGVEPLGLSLGSEVHRHHLVLLNGNLLGVHRHPHHFVAAFRRLRRAGRVRAFSHIHIADDQRCVLLSTDGGRVCRPLIVVHPTTGAVAVTQEMLLGLRLGTLTFEDLVGYGAAEYVDVHEEGDAMIAVTPAEIEPGITTHIEVEPFTLLGVVAGCIPYPHHNQSPRITYQCQMGKQSMGLPTTNFQHRIDTVLFGIMYPQKPLCSTATADIAGLDRLPGGTNTIVAVMSYSGYDIEDASILNRSALDRGFGRCYILKKYTLTLKRSAARASEKVITKAQLAAAAAASAAAAAKAGGNPAAASTSSARLADAPQLRSLDIDGLVAPGTVVRDGDVLVNRYIPSADAATLAAGGPGSEAKAPLRPSPMVYKGAVPGTVSQTLVTVAEDDTVIIKILIRQVRRPELGDKFSSRHGQKGVNGLQVTDSDLPFNRDGLMPDLVMNPHGFPSRMTVGKMLEQIASKAALMDGKCHRGTVFASDAVTSTARVLIEAGMNYGGKELMTSGITGEPLRGYVFFGPIYYQKLKHMVQDKMHARARGRSSALTHQPLEGRSRGGGLRMGEMERDCLVAYGASMLVVERLMLVSDAYVAVVCKQCGMIGYRSAHGCTCASCEGGDYERCGREPCPRCPPGWCSMCGSGEGTTTVTMPYACKLLLQEMAAMGVLAKLTLT